MKKQNSHPNEFAFLLALKKRKDLDPDPEFVESLRFRLMQTSNKPVNQPGKLSILLASSLALFTFFILVLPFLDSMTTKKELSQARKQIVPAKEVPTASDAEPPPHVEKHTYDLGQLLNENLHYKDLYQTLSKEIKSEEGAKVFILYLHALKQRDMDEIKLYAFTRRESKIEDLIEIYNKIDYETITIDKATPSKAEPSYEVQLGYQLAGSSKKEKRALHIQLNDGIDISIYESASGQN
ncbi:hypothetical protein [Bacillus sp. FJAT-27245]|uniref:hypothetical protein n=1 Tax=Bacillus sp. FJAT-27245 TaxID=1684144 RepID=UPI0006A762DD|nr:hypothetical protein [Bacillus sp. FJAT-27245]